MAKPNSVANIQGVPGGPTIRSNGIVAATMKYVVNMTHFMGRRSARTPIMSRPTMLEHRMMMLALDHTVSRRACDRKPWSWNTNFMWRLMAPMEPMEQTLPMSNSQKVDLRTRYPK